MLAGHEEKVISGVNGGKQYTLWHLCQRCGDAEVGKKWQYLSQRRAQMQYPTYRAAGWPIGSGIVESANKLVVEARLKGAGMHWKPENVNPMLILRNAVCNDRWEETWQGRQTQGRQSRQQKREEQTRARLHQAVIRLLRLWLPMRLLRSSPEETPPPSAISQPSAASPHVSAAPKGRTEAQKRWGRRPISPRGMRLQAEFANH